MTEKTFIIKFFFQNQLMKEIILPCESLNQAIKISTDIVSGYISWDKIKVEC
jgi:hypothetical protein